MSGQLVSVGRKKHHHGRSEKRAETLYSNEVCGDVEIPEICVFSMKGACKLEKKGCPRLHSKGPVHWQFQCGVHWYNFIFFQCKVLESTYRDVKMDGIKLNGLEPTKSVASRELSKYLGIEPWYVNFDTMKMKGEMTQKTFTVRRLTTYSSESNKDLRTIYFQWYFLGNHGEWIRYGEKGSSDGLTSSLSSDDIEKQYVLSPSLPIHFDNAKFKYTLDFNNMTQCNTSTMKIRKVRRRPLVTQQDSFGGAKKSTVKESSLPAHWSNMHDGESLKIVMLSPGSEEYNRVQSLITNLSFMSVVGIERVQNLFLYRAFCNKEAEFAVRYGKDKVNKRPLFHGTKADIVKNICKENFDWRLHGTNSGHAYGRGTYFSNDVSYSCGYASPDHGGVRYIIMAQVLLGAVVHGNSSISRPPINGNTGYPFDTTVDNVSKPKIYVKYDKQEYYPEYIIKIK